MVSKRIYWAILILSVLIGTYFYGLESEKYSSRFLILFALVPFLLFAGSVHGLIAHWLRSSVKSSMLIYPIIMGAIFILLFLIHIFVILPMVCPDFLNR